MARTVWALPRNGTSDDAAQAAWNTRHHWVLDEMALCKVG
jgi:hypothetical protein